LLDSLLQEIKNSRFQKLWYSIKVIKTYENSGN